MVNTNKDHKLKQLRVNVFLIFVLEHMLDNLLVMFLLGMQRHSLKKRSVDLAAKIYALFGKDVASQEVLVALANVFGRDGRAKDTVEHKFNIGDLLVKLVR